MSARAIDFLVWRAAQSVNWDCTHKDIADEIGLSARAVSAIMARRGWKCLPQDMEFSQPGAGKSTATRRLNAGDIEGGCEAISWWNKAGSKVVRGLVRRRTEEVALCLV